MSSFAFLQSEWPLACEAALDTLPWSTWPRSAPCGQRVRMALEAA